MGPVGVRVMQNLQAVTGVAVPVALQKPDLRDDLEVSAIAGGEQI